MELGMIGLGRLGLNMATRLVRRGHTVVGTAKGDASRAALREAGGKPVPSAAEVVAALAPPRLIWLMVPSGPVVDEVMAGLGPRLAPLDLVVDGGNSNYRDSMRRGKELAADRIGFLDVGT